MTKSSFYFTIPHIGLSRRDCPRIGDLCNSGALSGRCNDNNICEYDPVLSIGYCAPFDENSDHEDKHDCPIIGEICNLGELCGRCNDKNICEYDPVLSLGLLALDNCAPFDENSDPDECPMICVENYKPVCGKDGNTYDNECFLEATKCLEGKEPIEFEYEGPCDFDIERGK